MYIDTLIRIKNAFMRKKERIKVPYSRLNMEILELLVKKGYLESVVRKGRGLKRIIDIQLKYEGLKPAISDIKFLSVPSRKVYAGYKDLKRSKQGYGRYFISTSKGVLTDSEARREKLGGQVLFEVW